MNTINETSEQYLAEIRGDLRRLQRGFLYIRNSMRKMELNSFTENKIKRVEELLNDFRWRLDHTRKTEYYPDDVIHQSFNDMTNEIEWRMKELKMIRNGKTISGESVTDSAAGEYQRHEDQNV